MNEGLKRELQRIIQDDPWMIDILKTVRNLELNDCWIGAGFVRNKVWDVKHGKTRTPLNDIDVIHFDDIRTEKTFDQQLEERLKDSSPSLNWSVKNQARMHLRNNHEPYSNCNHAISFWPETATSVAIRLNAQDEIECIAPHDLKDLFNLLVVPTPDFNPTTYRERIAQKEWEKSWNQLKIRME